MKQRTVTIKKSTLSESSDHGYVDGTMADRIALAWKLSEEVWSLANQDSDAERRLQRHVAVLTRRER